MRPVCEPDQIFVQEQQLNRTSDNLHLNHAGICRPAEPRFALTTGASVRRPRGTFTPTHSLELCGAQMGLKTGGGRVR